MKIINNLPQKTGVQNQIGILDNLKTAIKENIVLSINWLYSTFLDILGSNDISEIGDGSITGAISAINHPLTEKLISDQISINDSNITISGACAENGIILITFHIHKGANGVISGTISDAYAPRMPISGAWSVNGTGADAGAIYGAEIRADGNIHIWCGRQIQGTNFVTFTYPQKRKTTN